MTQRTKNILITIGFLVVAVISYNFAIANTLELRSEYKTLKTDAVVFENLPAQLSNLKQKEIYFDSLLQKYQLNEYSMQNSILKAITVYTEDKGIKILDFVEPHSSLKDDLTINSYQFTLQGDYKSIIKLIYQFKQHTKFGEIINLHFEKKKNFRTGKNYLQARVLLRSFG
jgi:Tfp pilus assembly protein PilO